MTKLTRADVERIITEVGARYGALIIVEDLGTSGGKRWWRCACDCGGETVAPTGHLRSGNTTSCGCRGRSATRARSWKHGHAVRSGKSAEYIVWEGMVRRCHSPAATNYRNYGARGVQVCDEWRQNFAAFLAHIGPRPSAEHSVDRIDPTGDYAPGNVRWATRLEQAANKRSKRWPEAVQS